MIARKERKKENDDEVRERKGRKGMKRKGRNDGTKGVGEGKRRRAGEE